MHTTSAAANGLPDMVDTSSSVDRRDAFLLTKIVSRVVISSKIQKGYPSEHDCECLRTIMLAVSLSQKLNPAPIAPVKTKDIQPSTRSSSLPLLLHLIVIQPLEIDLENLTPSPIAVG